MRVFFLGSGAAEGFPALFSRTPINQEALRRGGKNLRLRSGILLDETLRVDLCPDALAQVHKYPERDLTAIEHLLFTHTHDDHFAVRELQYFSCNFAPDREQPLQVWATDYALTKLQAELESFFEEPPLRCRPLTPFQEVQVGHLFVTPLTAHHKTDELCLNYLFREGEAENARYLLYASDTGWYDPPTWEFLEGVSLDGAIIECGKGISSNPYDGHLSLDECIAFKNKLRLTPGAPVYLTHICHTGLLLHEEMEARCEPHEISVAYDGLEFVL
ncbi:MBL fold metallo-hydrolase [Armatimonas sp.]|uniref:MBL fold metallo-hydrolase n=1 Tax=Armatimonas sp. TaxID=1872638 RepID=UPI00374CFFA6